MNSELIKIKMLLYARKRHTFGHRDLRTVTITSRARPYRGFLAVQDDAIVWQRKYHTNSRTRECAWMWLNARIIRSSSITKKKICFK